LSVSVAFAVAGAAGTVTAAAPTVHLTRMPGHGLQPKAVLDHKGTLHFVYLAGDAGGSDVFYTRRNTGES